MRRILLAVAAFALLVALAPAAAAGGGSSLYPVQDRYEPGDIGTAVGYVSVSPAGGWFDDGPYFTYADGGPSRRFPLGQVTIEPTRFGAGMARVSLTFEVPAKLAAGHYDLVVCNDRCVKGLGDLVGGTLNVGVDPMRPIVREWPPDEFETVNLPDGATTTWPITPTAAAIKPAVSPAPVTPVAQPVRTPSAPLRTGPEANPAALVIGGALTAVFVGLVLVALREG